MYEQALRVICMFSEKHARDWDTALAVAGFGMPYYSPVVLLQLTLASLGDPVLI